MKTRKDLSDAVLQKQTFPNNNSEHKGSIYKQCKKSAYVDDIHKDKEENNREYFLFSSVLCSEVVHDTSSALILGRSIFKDACFSFHCFITNHPSM